MVAGPVQSFTKDKIKARWAERYTSDAINKKFLGLPRGIYLGFVPSESGLTLSLRPDKVLTFSGQSGTFVEGNTVTGSISFATATIRVVSAGYILIDNVVGIFQSGETITSAGPASATVELFVEEDISFGRVVSSSSLAGGRSEHMVDVFTTDTPTLDFTGFPDGTYYVILTATYEIGATTVGSVITRTTPAPSGAQEVLICRVTKVGAALTLVESTSPATRHEPIAFEGQRIGFMPGGSMEALLAAISITDEVEAARKQTDGTVSAAFSPSSPQTTGLPDRLNTDLSNVSMGSRIGKHLISVRSNDFTLSAPATSANVSASFGARNRDYEPYKDQSPATGIAIPAGVPTAILAEGIDFVELTIGAPAGTFTTGLQITGADSGATAIIKDVIGGGTTLIVGDFVRSFYIGEVVNQVAPAANGTVTAVDLREGAITDTTGVTTGQNIVNVIDVLTGNKPVDGAVPVFGRLVYDPAGGSGNSGEYTLSGGKTLDFVPSTTTVNATGTPLVIPGDVDIGDLIEGADGRFYEVITASPTLLTLPVAKPYVGPTAIGSTGRRRRRFILEFKKVVAGVETTATLAAGDYRFFFPAWFTSAKSNFNALLSSEAPGGTTVGAATTSDPGIVQLINDGVTATAGQVLDSTDARIGAVKGRAGSGAVSGFQQVVRIIAGAGAGISLVEAAGELQFTITASGVGTGLGGINQNVSNSATGGGVTTLSVVPGFEPRIGFVVTNYPAGIGAGASFGVFAGTATALALYHEANALGGGFMTVGSGDTYVNVNGGWTCTAFASSGVTISGGAVTSAYMMVLGGN
jgi:hypothetical protein